MQCGSVRNILLTAVLFLTLPSCVQSNAVSTQVRPDRVPGVTVSGNVTATITEFEVPGTNAMPEGIFFGKRDGSTWYSAEAIDQVGQFNPKTKTFQVFHLRPGTKPTSLVEHSGSGVQSTLYFTSRYDGYIGEFDPNTRDVREFHIVEGRIRLENLIFDRNGVIWFTVAKAEPPQFPQGSKIGSLNLFSSEIRLATVPTINASPYDLAVNSKGTIFFSELNSPRIGRVEPDTMKVSEYTLPNAKAGVQGLTITPDDTLWYTDNTRGYLGRFDPRTRKSDEWPSPSGPRSRPASIVSVGEIIWYVESGTEPNMLVRFDPVRQQFQSWPVPGAEEIGQIYSEANGTLWFTRPIANRIGQVKVVQEQK
jgi:virginiamycin B lyase